MAGKYSLPFNNTSSIDTNDIRTVITNSTIGGAGSIVGLYELWVAGEASSTTPIRLVVNRSTAGTTPGGAPTVSKLSPSAPANTFTAASTWAAQPTLGSDILTPGFNGFGNVIRWVAPPNSQVIQMTVTAGTSVNISFRSRSGTTTVNGHFLVEEL
jgi:hypothetical protein